MMKNWMSRWAAVLTVCMIAALAAPVLGHAETGTEVIDLSHDNPTSWGYTLGTKDEIKRWQTFTPSFGGSLQRVGLYLVEKMGEGELSPLVVELYETAGGLPTGEPLASVSVPPDQVAFQTEMIVEFPYDGLTAGKQYAISLTQEVLSENGLMHNYSWPTREVAPGEKFGKFADGRWVDESFLGDGWMKVYILFERTAPVPSSITLSPKYLNLSPGETAVLEAVVRDQYGDPMPDAEIEWSSDNLSVAQVVYGEVTAVANGTARVTAAAGGVSAETIVTVSDADGVVPEPGMVITEDTVLKPGLYDFSSGQGLIIGADNIVLDGNGAVLIGPGSLEAGPDSFRGTGIYSEGISGVTIRNVTAKGFATGLHVKNGSGWTIEGNNFSDNYTNPDFGWGDGEMHSAVLLEHVSGSLIEHNRGNNVWNGLHLRHSDRNIIRYNDFSRTSNVSLKMWNASENIVSDNNFSYGIRIAPGEVHARDSTSLLLESGSNNNQFYRNDFTHGGDGIFIRVLNGWVSTGNYFEENDASYANNNAVESWSPGNIFVRNIANYSSYGFWLGGSDNTVLIGNIVRYNGGYNGETPNNAPEDFGNAGIAVVNGASSHFVMMDNDIQFNNGPGVAIRYHDDYPAYHWIIQNNTIRNNKNDPRGYKGYGIYVKNAKWLDIAGNDIADNDADAIKIDANVSDVFLREAQPGDPVPRAHAVVSAQTAAVGQEVVFDASGSNDPAGLPLNFRWDLGDGTIEGDAVVRHRYEAPGFYRVGLTVNNGKLADLAFFNIYIYDNEPEFGTEDDGSGWELISSDPNARLAADTEHVIQGTSSIRVTAERGTSHTLVYPRTKDWHLDAEKADTLSFWVKFNAEHGNNQASKKPVVRLHQDEHNYVEYRPNIPFLEQLFAPVSEERYGWKQLRISLSGDDPVWTRTVTGAPDMSDIRYMTIEEGPSASGISQFWIDALHVFRNAAEPDVSVNVAGNEAAQGHPSPIGTPVASGGDAWAPLNDAPVFNGSATPRWIPDMSAYPGERVWYGVDLGEKRLVNRVDIWFYHNPSGTPAEDAEWKPEAFEVQYWDGKKWKVVQQATGGKVRPNRNTVTFKPVETSMLRAVLTPHVTGIGAAAPSIYGFAAYNTGNVAGNALGKAHPAVTAISSESQTVALEQVGVFVNRKGTSLTDLIVEVYKTADNGFPAGTPLKSVTVPLEEVRFGDETKVDIGLEGLEPGKTYAVALTQQTLAPNGLEDHYRWPTRNIGVSEKFGKYAHGNWVDESFLGTGWLKLYTDRGLIDYSFPNPGGTGYGLGHLDEAKRWQTFTLPEDRVWETIDGSIRPDNGWIAGEGTTDPWIELKFAEERTINTANIYFGEHADGTISLPDNVQLMYWNGSEWKHVKLVGPKHPIRAGFNAYTFQTVTTDRFRLTVTPSADASVEIREIELMLYHGKPLGK